MSRPDTSRYDKRRRIAIARGTWRPLVSVAHARAHILHLRHCGASLPEIAARAGLPVRTVQAIAYGRTRRIRQETRDALLAVPALTAAQLAWRRIEGLVALGWTQEWIGAQLGQRGDLSVSRHRVHARTALRIAELAERIGDTRGPSERARRYAAARGWKTPAAWTEDYAEPEPLDEDVVDEVLVERAIAGERVSLTDVERRAVVERMTAAGLPSYRIGEVLHASGTTTRRLQAEVAA